MATSLGKIIADFNTSPTAKWAVGATTGTLASATDDDGVALPTGKYFFTIDRSNANKEYISCTVTGTSVTDIKNVSRQGVETSGTTKEHTKTSEIVITDFAHIKKMNDLLDGTTGLNASVPLKYDGTATVATANTIATKKYVDDTASVGSPNASTSTKGLAKLSTAPASASNPISVGDNDPRIPTQGENDALVGTYGTPSSSNKFVTETDPNFTGIVKTTGDQTVAGIKTFSSIPVLPASDPTTANQAVRKAYVDGLLVDTTGSVVDGTSTIYYRKRGNFYYSLWINRNGSTELLSGSDTSASIRLATLLGKTYSSQSIYGTTDIQASIAQSYWTGAAWASQSLDLKYCITSIILV